VSRIGARHAMSWGRKSFLFA